MKVLLFTSALALSACGRYELPATTQPAAATPAGQEQQAATPPAAPAPKPQPTKVHVHTETNVDVVIGDAPAAAAGSGERAGGSEAGNDSGTMIRFADGAFGWFLADGTFAHGAAYVHGQQADAYCRFEAPDCAGRCVVDELPVKESLFSNGAIYLRAIETETNRGRVVVASAWRNGACEADIRTFQTSYFPAQSWVLDPGDSTIPADHEGDR